MPTALDFSGLEGGRLLLCRHGQTAFNAGFRYQGQIDEPLDDIGRGQAAALGRRLVDERIDAAYTSDLCRARETASLALGERRVPISTDVRLREAHFGRWEGLTFAEIEQRFPDDVAGRRKDHVNFVIPGGESLVQVAGRVQEFLAETLPRHRGESVLVVAHGGTLNGFISVLLDIPFTSWFRLRNRNANLSVVEFTAQRPVLLSFNETWHLEGPGD